MSSQDKEQLKQQFKADMRQARKNVIKGVLFIAGGIVSAIELVIVQGVHRKPVKRIRARKPRPVIYRQVIQRPATPRIVYLRERR